MEDNKKLIEGINCKTKRAWEEFYKTYYVSLCNHVYRILLDEEIATDIVQEIFLKIWDSKLVFENERALISYLYRAGTNNSLKYLRSQNTEQERLKRWYDIEQEMTEDDFSSVVREEVLRKLLLLIDQLPAERRKIILMSMENMSGEEIAQKLGVTIHTVKQQKYRAYKFIIEQLGEHWIIALYFFL